MNAAELALSLFVASNTIRVLAYVPQIVRIRRDTTGVAAISYCTWGLFAASHLSTVGYAAIAVGDPVMAAIFTANALCCALIIALTAYKRRQFASGSGRSRASAARSVLRASAGARPDLRRAERGSPELRAILNPAYPDVWVQWHPTRGSVVRSRYAEGGSRELLASRSGRDAPETRQAADDLAQHSSN